MAGLEVAERVRDDDVDLAKSVLPVKGQGFGCRSQRGVCSLKSAPRLLVARIHLVTANVGGGGVEGKSLAVIVTGERSHRMAPVKGWSRGW
ncbi:MAG: hypothetical protein IH941_13170 [Acidobacteria bacterium]|nr:hypothetical protein [Acidobacteriota bacterium]